MSLSTVANSRLFVWMMHEVAGNGRVTCHVARRFNHNNNNNNNNKPDQLGVQH